LFCNIDHFGNTSAASIPLAMDEALENGTIKFDKNKKQKIAMVGFGAGLTWGASVLDF
jgi:3-oxoacyl-[acyl-carrier-protein] synthase-3